MARNGNGPLTSMDIVRQQNYGPIPQPGSKRSFEQISFTEPQLHHDVSVFAAPPTRIVSALPSSRPCPGATERTRLVASRIHDTPHISDEDSNETVCARDLDVSTIPSSSLNPLLSLSHPRYGLPARLVENFASMGIKHIYPWQSSCLLGRGLLSGEKNLVYTAPTGGGKSLVADVLMFKNVLSSPNTKGILVLPYVALVQEKIGWLRKAVEGVEKDLQIPSQSPEPRLCKWPQSRPVRVVGFFGGSKTRATWSDLILQSAHSKRHSTRNVERRYQQC